MTNIAAIIETSVSRIDAAYEHGFVQRRRLGLSQVGHKCHRFLWYKHHGYDEPTPDGKTLRLFQLGNIIEDQVAADLQLAGFNVFDRQERVEITLDGITLNGSIDGKINGLIESSRDHVWECKSIGSKGWASLLKTGYEAHNRQYKGQVHSYMLATGLTRAFVTVYNKDTSELYQERIKLDKGWVVDMLQDAFIAIAKTDPPEPIDDFDCKWCQFIGVCK